jgi:oxygen-independent coproporphyrinogen-3 oxidase
LQSLDNDILKLMRRRHNAKKALDSITNAYNSGFNNISADLIYGINGLESKDFEKHLEIICKLPISHISAYHLGIEKGSLFYKMLKENKISEIDESVSFEQYNILINTVQDYDFKQYEISNFAKNNKISHHNSSYWDRSIYYGFGPSAHSFNGDQRLYNTSNIQKYIREGLENNFTQEYENLNNIDIINESLMLGLRTIKGINLGKYQKDFGKSELTRLNTQISKLDKNWFNNSETFISLSREGMFVSDYILSQLFIE